MCSSYDVGCSNYLIISQKLKACFVSGNNFLVIKECAINVQQSILVVFSDGFLYSDLTCIYKKKTLWPLFMDGVQLPHG